MEGIKISSIKFHNTVDGAKRLYNEQHFFFQKRGLFKLRLIFYLKQTFKTKMYT